MQLRARQRALDTTDERISELDGVRGGEAGFAAALQDGRNIDGTATSEVQGVLGQAFAALERLGGVEAEIKGGQEAGEVCVD